MEKVLITRKWGGIGDLLMMRMIFEDLAASGVKVDWAVPAELREVCLNHPFVNCVLDVSKVERAAYPLVVDLSECCGVYERSMGRAGTMHRADIWAERCGIRLENHSQWLSVGADDLEWARKRLGGRRIVLAPFASVGARSLSGSQIGAILEAYPGRVTILHNERVPVGEELRLDGLSLRQWLAVLAEADAVVSVDSAAFHAAGGLGKPLVGIFSYTNGSTYSRYYPTAGIVQVDPGCGGACYNYGLCPLSSGLRKPCIEIPSETILAGVAQVVEK